MPRKIRELKAEIVREGFVICPSLAKAAMSVGDILCSEKTLTVPGKDRDDVPLYREKNN
jgi:hypothetical protein